MMRVVPKILGRRGAALLLTGILWLFVAWGVALMPIPISRVRAPHEYAPTALRVAGWAIAGATAIICAFLWKQVKAPDGLHRLDRFGFALLIIMPMERALSWLLVLILYIPGMPHIIPLPQLGAAVAGFSVWLVVSLHLWLINGWQEPITAPEIAIPGVT